jgi:hypothetical protein
MVLIVGLILSASTFSFLRQSLVDTPQASAGPTANQRGAHGEPSRDGSDPN